MREGAIEVDLSQPLCDDGRRREAGIGYGGALIVPASISPNKSPIVWSISSRLHVEVTTSAAAAAAAKDDAMMPATASRVPEEKNRGRIIVSECYE